MIGPSHALVAMAGAGAMCWYIWASGDPPATKQATWAVEIAAGLIAAYVWERAMRLAPPLRFLDRVLSRHGW